MKRLVPLILSILSIQHAYAGGRETIYLWPDEVPGQTEPKGQPVISNNSQRNRQIGTVTNPALVVYEAAPEKRNGAAVIVCPGGGYNFLSIDKEGYEIGHWLSNMGYTAFVLQYRVPGKEPGALQDALRAIRYVRGMRGKWDIDTDRIGVLGFSAGGSLSARASTRYAEALYDPVDAFDSLSARPDFAVLIYPAYLDRGSGKTLTPELKVNGETPPMFIFVAADDRYANSSIVMASALRSENLPFELHILPDGGHGFGMRKGNRSAETWPKLCEDWIKRTIFGK